jgi:hypothetical protein
LALAYGCPESRDLVTLLLIGDGRRRSFPSLLTISKNREALKDQTDKYLTRSSRHADRTLRSNYIDQCKKIAPMKVAAGVSGTSIRSSTGDGSSSTMRERGPELALGRQPSR